MCSPIPVPEPSRNVVLKSLSRDRGKLADRYRVRFAAAPFAYHELDHRGIITYANDAECILLGLRRENLIGKPLWELASPEDRQAVQLHVTGRLSGALLVPGITLKIPDGDAHIRTFIPQDWLVHDSEGNIAGLRSTLLDITAQEEAEAELQASEERVRTAAAKVRCDFRRIASEVALCSLRGDCLRDRNARRPRRVESALLGEASARVLFRAVAQTPVSVMITNASGNIDYVNAAFTVASGYLAGEVIGKSASMLQSAEPSADQSRAMWAAIRNGRWHGEVRNRRKTGESYLLSATISPIRNSYGEVTHYLEVAEEITERLSQELSLASEKGNHRVVDAVVDRLMLLSRSGTPWPSGPAAKLLPDVADPLDIPCNDLWRHNIGAAAASHKDSSPKPSEGVPQSEGKRSSIHNAHGAVDQPVEIFREPNDTSETEQFVLAEGPARGQTRVAPKAIWNDSLTGLQTAIGDLTVMAFTCRSLSTANGQPGDVIAAADLRRLASEIPGAVAQIRAAMKRVSRAARAAVRHPKKPLA